MLMQRYRGRILYTAILLYRPMLARLTFRPNARMELIDAFAPDNYSVEQLFLVQSAIKCVNSALELITLAFENLSKAIKSVVSNK